MIPNSINGSINPAQFGSLNPPEGKNDIKPQRLTSQEVELEEQLAYLDRLQKEEEAVQPKENEDAADAQMPNIEPSELNIPINPIFDDEFDGMEPLFNIGKQVFGSSAIQFRALGPSMGVLATFLGMTNRDILPGVVGLGMTAASAFFLNSKVQELFVGNTQAKSALGWLGSKTMTAAQAGLTAYSFASGVGMLSSAYGAVRALGLLSTTASIGTGLYSLYTAKEVSEEAQGSSAWQMLKSVGTVGAIGYGAIAGLGATLGLGSLPGVGAAAGVLKSVADNASFGSRLFTGLTHFIAQKPIELALALGLTLGTQLLMWKVTGTAFQNLNAEIEKINNSNKYGPTLEMLQGIGQEQYHEIITKETGMEYEKIKEAFEPLRSRNPNYPENAAKPVIARLMLLNQEVYAEGGAMQQYAEHMNANKLQDAHEFLNKELRPKLMMLVYLKHCIISPTRPQFGSIIGNPGSQEYFSYVSHLLGTAVKLPLNEVNPGKIQEESHLILMKENELQQQYYLFKAMQEQEFLKEQMAE